MTGILGVVYNGISELVIGKVCAPQALGYYSQGRKYPLAIITVLTNAVQNVLFPVYSSIRDDEEAFLAMLKRTLMIGSFFIMPLSLLLFVVAEPLVLILLTEKWLPCIAIFQLTCFSYCFLMITSVNTRGYLARGRSDLYLQQQVVKVFIGLIAICSTAIITKNINATALAFCLVTLFNTLIIDCCKAGRVLNYSMMKQYADITPIFILSVVSALFAFSLGAFNLAPIALLAAQSAVFIGIYFLGTIIVPSKTLRICRSVMIRILRKEAID